ncbi:MAG: protein kinase [Anaerolineae bacterium]|nr:protein kinase [Anaerolineae bacterium]
MTNEWKGRVVGGYQLAEEIGHGSAAVVYRAYQPQLERWVAVKILEVSTSGGQNFLQRFRREARAIAALRHPNISTIYDYGEDQGIAYIVMEYVPGGPLLTPTKGGELMLYKEALGIVIPVAEALSYAHSQGIIHRDVKPANILMARPDWPLLSDFGLAKVIGSQKKLTQPGSILGTAVYLSPEQVAGKEVDYRTDIYSLAILLYEMVTGRFPFKGNSAAETMLLRMYEQPTPPRQVNPNIPSSLEVVMLRALERDPDARYATMDIFISDLKRAGQGTSNKLTPPAVTETVQMITTRLGGGGQAISGPQLFIATSGIALPIPMGDEVVIGRRDPMLPKSPDLDLEPYGGGSAGVSRYHARLLHRPEGWFLEDLQSTNGTYVNEVRLVQQRPVRLRSGDMVRFAQLTLIFNEA